MKKKNKRQGEHFEKFFRSGNGLLSATDLAEFLGVPLSWVYSRTREKGPGAIPRIKLGKYLKFQLCDVEEWILLQNMDA